MIKRLLLCTALLLAPAVFLRAETSPEAAASPAKVDLEALMQRVKEKLQSGQTSPEALAPEMAEFDTLLAKYDGQKTDDVANILLIKAVIYLQVFEDTSKALELFKKLKADFPETEPGSQVDKVISKIEDAQNAEARKQALIGKAAPAITFTWSSDGKLKSLEDLKGKVVVLDFWATWCGPCIRSFPNIRELVAHYAGYDVVVVGVTSIQGSVVNLESKPIVTEGDPAREMSLMNDFIKKFDMTWTVAFSEQEVFNPEYGVDGIPFLAILAPDGTVRHIGLHPGMAIEEKTEKIDAILKEFGRKVPAGS